MSHTPYLVRRIVNPEAHREFASSIKSAGERFCPQTDTFSADGARLAASAYDGMVRMWHAQSAALEREIRIGPRGGVINALACTLDSTPDGRHVATANSNGTLYLRVSPRPPTKASREYYPIAGPRLPDRSG